MSDLLSLLQSSRPALAKSTKSRLVWEPGDRLPLAAIDALLEESAL